MMGHDVVPCRIYTVTVDVRMSQNLVICDLDCGKSDRIVGLLEPSGCGTKISTIITIQPHARQVRRRCLREPHLEMHPPIESGASTDTETSVPLVGTDYSRRGLDMAGAAAARRTPSLPLASRLPQ